HPRGGQGRRDQADAGAEVHARTGAGLHRGRRARRGDPEGNPPAQEAAHRERAQAGVARRLIPRYPPASHQTRRRSGKGGAMPLFNRVFHRVFHRALPLAALLACASAGSAAAQDTTFAYDEATVAGLQERMAQGTLDSRTLVRAYLDRIAAIDKAGPAINAVIELNPGAMAEA